MLYAFPWLTIVIGLLLLLFAGSIRLGAVMPVRLSGLAFILGGISLGIALLAITAESFLLGCLHGFSIVMFAAGMISLVTAVIQGMIRGH